MKAINRQTCDNCFYQTTCTKPKKDLFASDDEQNPARNCLDFKQAGIRTGNVMINGLGHQWIE